MRVIQGLFIFHDPHLKNQAIRAAEVSCGEFRQECIPQEIPVQLDNNIALSTAVHRAATSGRARLDIFKDHLSQHRTFVKNRPGERIDRRPSGTILPLGRPAQQSLQVAETVRPISRLEPAAIGVQLDQVRCSPGVKLQKENGTNQTRITRPLPPVFESAGIG